MEIVILITVLLLSAFFSGLEFAFISANKLQIELKKAKGGLIGRTLAHYYRQPTYFLGATLIGNNVALVIYGILMAQLLEPSLSSVLGQSELAILLVQTVISTIIILIIGEFLPKSLFRLNPNGILNLVAVPFLLLYGLLWIFVVFVVWLSKLLLRFLLGIEYENEEKAAFSRVDLQDYLEQAHVQEENQEEIDPSLFQKTLDLLNIKVRECMVPRLEIQAVEISENLEAIRNLFIETKHSKLLVYEKTIDNIKGYIHHLDILKGNKTIWELVIVPEVMPARKLLNTFILQGKSIAWVVDEFGGTAGIVTLEDIIEEIVGEIRDEHDDKELSFTHKKIGDNEYEFSARLEIDFLNEQYTLQIPTGDYETLAGYIVNKHQDIPQQGDTISIDTFTFTILKVSKTRIDTVRMYVIG